MPQLVLLVDDDPDARTICATILEHHGYTVIQAEDGEEGVRLAEGEMPDVVLMDVNLPVVDGWAATRRLKEGAQTSRIPVIAFTSRATRADRDQAASAGCAGYLTKPCPPTLIVEEVRRVLRRSGSPAAGER